MRSIPDPIPDSVRASNGVARKNTPKAQKGGSALGAPSHTLYANWSLPATTN